jgi:hypothetical protein
VWSDLARSPIATARLGVTGFGRNLLVALGFYALVYIGSILDHGNTDIRYRHSWIWVNTASNPASPPRMEVRWHLQAIWWLLYSARLFQTGRWIARRAPGREIAASVAVACAGWIAIFACAILAPHFGMMVSLTYMMATGIAHDAILFACIRSTKTI